MVYKVVSKFCKSLTAFLDPCLCPVYVYVRPTGGRPHKGNTYLLEPLIHITVLQPLLPPAILALSMENFSHKYEMSMLNFRTLSMGLV